MLLICGYWDENYSEKLIEIQERQWIKNLDLGNDQLLEEYDIRLDGKSLSREDADVMIEFIRKRRSEK